MLFDIKDIEEKIQELTGDIKETLFREPRCIFWTERIKELVELMAKRETAIFLGASDPRDKLQFMCELKAYKKIIQALGSLEPLARPSKRGS